MALQPAGSGLFHATAWPGGLRYEDGFVTTSEEAALLAWIAALSLEEAQYRQYTARRRTMSFGASYDFERNALTIEPPVPDALLPLRERCAAWANVAPEAFAQALVSEYRPGTALGWHRDVPDFEVIVGVSLTGAARMRFRPYVDARVARDADAGPRRASFALDLAPRSVYVLRDDVRWRWQHAVSPTPGLRHSITFRSRRGHARARASRQRSGDAP